MNNNKADFKNYLQTPDSIKIYNLRTNYKDFDSFIIDPIVNVIFKDQFFDYFIAVIAS
jgi:hypothetical protein